jgi:hypothetical protein
MLDPGAMTWSVCEYCDGIAQLNFGELWLCQAHGNALTEHAGGLEPLLEMSPEARRCLADAMLPRLVREDVGEPAPTFEN